MTKILLVRHGHVDGIHPERFRGRKDLRLSTLGAKQAQATAGHITSRWKPERVYCSPLSRCVRTAWEIGEAGRAQIETLDDLNDIDYGAWEWLTHPEVQVHWPDMLELWRRAPQRVKFPRGESLQDVDARVADALRLILAACRDKTAVIVGHDSSNRVLLMHLLGLPLSSYWTLAQSPCGISEIDVSEEAARVLSVNETQHLAAVTA